MCRKNTGEISPFPALQWTAMTVSGVSRKATLENSNRYSRCNQPFASTQKAKICSNVGGCQGEKMRVKKGLVRNNYARAQNFSKFKRENKIALKEN